MANVRIELDSDSIQTMLKSTEFAEVCDREARRMTQATGMEYVSDIHVGKYRVNAAGYREGENDD